MKNVDLKLAQTHQRFQQFYKQNLQQIYAELEPVRKEKMRSFWFRATIFSVLTVGYYLLCLTGFISKEAYTSEGMMKLTLAAIIIGGYWVYKPFVDYRTITKNRVMKIILSFWGNFTYRHEKDIIGEPVIKDSEIFSYFNKSEIDDAFTGYYNGVSLDVSEHDLRIKGDKGDTKIFKGALIMLDFPKKFEGKTVALNKGRWMNLPFNNPLLMLPILAMTAVVFMPLFFLWKDGLRSLHMHDFVFVMAPIFGAALVIAFLIIFIKIRHPRQATQKVKLEGLPFMRRWKVLTDDQIEARYVLTPVFMEKMLAVKHLFHGKHIDFSFFNNKLLIAVHTRKDLFETTSLFTPALSYHKVREVIGQLHAIFSVIDTLLGDTTKAKNKSSATKKSR